MVALLVAALERVFSAIASALTQPCVSEVGSRL